MVWGRSVGVDYQRLDRRPNLPPGLVASGSCDCEATPGLGRHFAYCCAARYPRSPPSSGPRFNVINGLPSFGLNGALTPPCTMTICSPGRA